MAGVVVPIDGDISPILGQFAKLPDRTQAEMDAVGRIVADEMRKGRIAKAFGEMPGVAEKNAKKAASMIAREMDRAAKETERAMADSARATEQALAAEARAAARAAKDIEASMERAARESADAMEAASRESMRAMSDMRQGAGAVFGGIVNDLDDVTGALAAMGPAGVAVGVALAGAAAAAAGLIAGGALVAYLYQAAGATGELTEEQDALALALDELNQNVGKEFVGFFRAMIKAALIGTFAVGDFLNEVLRVRDALVEWYDALSPMGRALIDVADGGFTRAASALKGLNEGASDGLDVFGEWNDRAESYIGAFGEHAETTETAAVATYDHAAAVRSVTAAMREQAPVIDEQMAKWEELDAAEASALAEVDKQIAQTMGQMPAALEQSSEATRDMRDTYLSSAQDIGGAIGDLSGLLLDQGNISKDAATALVVVQKAAGIAQIGISTAIAVMNALANYPGPAGPIAAAAYIATGVAQAAVVAATPTTFHTGGLVRAPDEVGITARNGEGVLTAQGVDAIGGQAGLNRANRGEGGSGSITVVQQYQHRVFDAFVADNVRSDGPLRKAIRGKRRIGHAGRR